jgi:hypothetical protein
MAIQADVVVLEKSKISFYLSILNFYYTDNIGICKNETPLSQLRLYNIFVFSVF